MRTTIKTCFKCNRSLPLSEFYKHSMMGDGHLGKCKECTKMDVATNYRANRPYYIKYEKMREQRAERRALKAVYASRRMPVKKRASYLTTNAVRDGRLIPQPCQICGATKVEAHHDDYSKPLEVRWLCRIHHMEHHGKRSYLLPDTIQP